MRPHNTWNPGQYLKFSGERTRPCEDLAARIAVSDVRNVIDLGCGPGNSTAVLAARWPRADITGLDSSPDMILSARRDHPDRQWVQADISTWAEEGKAAFDVVFSNAALQWLRDHASLFPKLLKRVAPGGALAVQMPANKDAPAHQCMRELAASAKWARHFGPGVRQWHTEDVGFYYDVLALRASKLEIWQTEYIHVLPDAAAIVEWYKATGLRPFLNALPHERDREAFTADYLEEIRRTFLPQSNGMILFPFRRIFIIASQATDS